MLFASIAMESRKTSKGERTSAFQEHYQSDEFSSSASRTVGCTDVRDAGDCIDLIEAWSNRDDAGHEVLPRYDSDVKASVHDIHKTLTMFEDMGTAYNLNQLDRKTLLRSFCIPTVQVFTKAWWLICWHRKGRLAREREGKFVESVYVEFQDMCTSLRQKKPSLVANPELRPAATVRALCLPHGHGEKLEDDLAWATSRRLSLALSSYVRRAEDGGEIAAELSKLAQGVEGLALPSGAPPKRGAVPAWEVILVPGSIDQPCDENWRRQRAAAAQLAQALDRFADRRALEVAAGHVEAASETVAA